MDGPAQPRTGGDTGDGTGDGTSDGTSDGRSDGSADDPRPALAAVVADLGARLPDDQPELLALPRFEAEREALARLADPAWAALGAQACSPAEAQRLLDLARERHARLPGAPRT